jgi:hypothetical protein
LLFYLVTLSICGAGDASLLAQSVEIVPGARFIFSRDVARRFGYAGTRFPIVPRSETGSDPKRAQPCTGAAAMLAKIPSPVVV